MLSKCETIQSKSQNLFAPENNYAVAKKNILEKEKN